MKKTISTEQTESNIVLILDLLAGTPEKLESLSNQLPRTQLLQALAVGERSFVEILAHLLNFEARVSEAVVQALLLEEPILADIHPERQLGKLLRYDRLPFVDLLAYFKFRRVILLNILKGLTQDQWSRSIREGGKKRRESVYWKMRALALHEHEHLVEIEVRIMEQ